MFQRLPPAAGFSVAVPEPSRIPTAPIGAAVSTPKAPEYVGPASSFTATVPAATLVTSRRPIPQPPTEAVARGFSASAPQKP